MVFNLLDERWIPVRRRSGMQEKIAPWEMTNNYLSDPIVDLDFFRPDFNGSMIQFLIGLLQSTAPAKTEDDWYKKLEKPPPPEWLKERFMNVHDAFNLDGEDPLFMQDFDLPEKAKKTDLSSLLLEQPGGQTKKNNIDHFIKRSSAEFVFCNGCSAIALFNMQTNAPAGGRGLRTSVRGGGPLTTLLKGETVWQTVLLNTRPCANVVDTPDPLVFPWLAPTRTSGSSNPLITTPEDADNLQLFWGMPRRYRLSESEQEKPCSLCGSDDGRWSAVSSVSYGINYEGAWHHPLSPYRKDKNDGTILALHPSGNITYKDWLGITMGDNETGLMPAAPLKHLCDTDYDNEVPVRLWAFGFDLDKAKAEGWAESVMPVFNLPDKWLRDFGINVSRLVKGAEHANSLLRFSVRNALYGRPVDVVHKGNSIKVSKWYVGDGAKGSGLSIFKGISAEFWADTEKEFFDLTGQIAEALKNGNTDLLTALPTQWRKIMVAHATRIFDRVADSAPADSSNLRSIAFARNELFMNLYGKKLQGILDISVPPTVKKEEEK